jgi:hypothetical protein
MLDCMILSVGSVLKSRWLVCLEGRTQHTVMYGPAQGFVLWCRQPVLFYGYRVRVLLAAASDPRVAHLAALH